MRNIKIPGDQKSDGTPRGNALAVQNAAYGSNKFVYLKRTGRGRSGIYHVKGRRKKNRVVRMVHQMEKPVVNIPKTEWLEPASDYAGKRTLRFYRRNLLRQVNRAQRMSR